MGEQAEVGEVGEGAAAGDPATSPETAQDAESGASEAEAISDPGEDGDTDWQLEAMRSGKELPGGGVLLFEPGDGSPGRRLVAVYGHPSTAGLGVLGEQGPEDTVKRLQSIAAGYEADGLAVLPTFEIIATVASASAGADGDYSRVTDLEVIRPWIEVAAANGVYVVLDLQPGRSDFLSRPSSTRSSCAFPTSGSPSIRSGGSSRTRST